MAEEFQESEVMFQEHFEDIPKQAKKHFPDFPKAKKKEKISASSLPVNIPEGNHWFQYGNSNVFDDEDDREMVPPHVITGQRIEGKMMSFSVCSGYGKALKGRDLRQFRNSILRMTGFLET